MDPWSGGPEAVTRSSVSAHTCTGIGNQVGTLQTPSPHPWGTETLLGTPGAPPGDAFSFWQSSSVCGRNRRVRDPGAPGDPARRPPAAGRAPRSCLGCPLRASEPRCRVLSPRRYFRCPADSSELAYDPPVVMNADTLGYCQKEAWCKLAFYLLSFFYYLYW